MGREEEAFRAAVVAGDVSARGVYADWLEERDRIPEADYHRWRACSPDVIHGDSPENLGDDPYSLCVYLTLEDLPPGLEDYLPAPMIHRDGGKESEKSSRILLDLWVSREDCERDLKAAWLAWWPTVLPGVPASLGR